jgi:hypothetical protein
MAPWSGGYRWFRSPNVTPVVMSFARCKSQRDTGSPFVSTIA